MRPDRVTANHRGYHGAMGEARSGASVGRLAAGEGAADGGDELVDGDPAVAVDIGAQALVR